MIFNRISIEGFGIIGKKITINFPSDGRIGISGDNESGKSTLFDAIEFALFGKSSSSKSKDDLITWNKEKFNLSLDFTSGDKSYRIDRSVSTKGHRAKLVQVVNGQPVSNTEVTTITEIAESIEDILGLDRDSYSKLIYIRQKELDGLKDLVKSKRTQLINKVMGISIFDDAYEKAHSDSKEKETERENLLQTIDFIKANHDKYKKNIEECKKLDEEIDPLKDEIDKLDEKINDLKSKLKEHKKASEYINKKETLDARIGEEKTLRSQLKANEEDEKKKNDYEKFLTPKFEEEYEKTRKAVTDLSQQEQKIQDEEEIIEEKEQSIPKNEIEQPELKQKSSSKRNIGIICVIMGGISLAMSPALPFLVIPGIAFFAISAIFIRQWKKLQSKLDDYREKLLPTRGIISMKEEELEGYKKSLTEIQNRSGIQSSTEAKSKLEELDKAIYETLGVKNLEEARGVKRDLSSNLDEGGIKQLENKVENLTKTIIDETKIIEGIKKSFPPKYDIKNGASEFEKTGGDVEKTQKERNGKDSDYKIKISLKKRLEQECEDLKSDYEIYPLKLDEIEEIKNNEKLLNFVTEHFKIISTKQREMVLPRAEMEINQMLPLITNNRYSNFEISEDLKFTVYVKEANGFKQRDLFSGGTQDQFLIALRLAFTKSILDSRIRADEYAFFMDEPISSSDQKRKAGIFELLDVPQVKQTFKQTFIIAHEDISDLVKHHLILERDSDDHTKIKSQSW